MAAATDSVYTLVTGLAAADDDVGRLVSSTSDDESDDGDDAAAGSAMLREARSAGAMASRRRVREVPPQPRRFLPRAVASGDPRRRIRRKKTEKIHPGIQRLLVNSQRIGPHPM